MTFTASEPSGVLTHLTGTVRAALWEAARRCDDELPGIAEILQDSVVFYIAGSRRQALGWYAADSWTYRQHSVHEIVINAASLSDSSEQVLTTALHEAAHAWGDAQCVRTTSRGGRYHNRRFGEIALQLRLDVARDPVIGCTTPGLTATGREQFHDLLTSIEAVLELSRRPRPHRRPTPGAAAEPPTPAATTGASGADSRYVFAACGCQKGTGQHITIRVARGSWRPSTITCRVCGQAFAERTGARQPRQLPLSARLKSRQQDDRNAEPGRQRAR